MALQKSEASRVWGLLWGLGMQNGTSRYISDQVQTTAEDIQNRGVARFLLDSQLLSLTAFLDFQDRPFQPLTHPSARKSSLAAETRLTGVAARVNASGASGCAKLNFLVGGEGVTYNDAVSSPENSGLRRKNRGRIPCTRSLSPNTQ